MAPDIASRIKSKLLRRRHSSSAAPSFISSRSVASSVGTASSGHHPSPSKTPSSIVQNQLQHPGPPQSHRETSGLSATSRTDATDDSSVRIITPSPGKTDEESQAEKKEAEDQVVESSKNEDDVAAADGPNLSSDPPANASTLPSSDRHLQLQPSSSPSIAHPRTPQPQTANRLHSIDEGSNPTSPANPGFDVENPFNLHVQVHDHDHDHDTLHHDPSNLSSSLTRDARPANLELANSSNLVPESPSLQTPSHFQRIPLPRRQSLVSNRQSSFIKTLLQGPPTHDADDAPDHDTVAMAVTRKIWVKRPHASATLVTINEDDLVDDVRDMILRKYANSLGRTFDSPDLTLRICPRDQSQKERFLGPEEHMARTVEAHFPGGQSVEEALVIDIPRRTPRPSPRPTGIYVTEDGRPPETAEGYFPPVGAPSPHQQPAATVPVQGSHSISVLGTGHIAPIPSPGGTRRYHRERPSRPGAQRTHTSSPNVITNGSQVHSSENSHGMQHYVHRPSHSRAHSNASDQKNHSQASGAPPMPTSPVNNAAQQARVATPPPRVSSPRPSANRLKKAKKASEYSTVSGAQGVLGGSVPPISVLIVEDNPINLKLLEAFVKKLKVRWQTAMNGRDAVKKWRNGGFHLVLMDIQLPIMSGLEATREIRRLERLNSIGVFSSSPSSLPEQEETTDGEVAEKDRLGNISLFKSPVIIVALTASSLQSDRHEALAAGCNDFLTKVSSSPGLNIPSLANTA